MLGADIKTIMADGQGVGQPQDEADLVQRDSRNVLSSHNAMLANQWCWGHSMAAC